MTRETGLEHLTLLGVSPPELVTVAAAAGFDAHLLKPVDMAVLDQTLAECLQKRIDAKTS